MNLTTRICRLVLCLCLPVAFVSRSLSAAPAAPTYQQHRIGAAVVSLPDHWKRLGAAVPVWIHVHGAPRVVEDAFASVGAPGVLVNITLPGLSKVYADHFTDPAVFPKLLGDVEALLQREAGGATARVGRVTISSFSAGFGGVRQLLNQPAAFERIGALLMADSIYCGYAGPVAEKRVDPDLMAGFLRYARLAADNQKRMLVSHSRQVPEGYASTTETADYLIRELQGTRSAEAQEWPGGFRLLSSFNRGQLDVFGFDGESPDAHMLHLRSIGALMQKVVPPGPAVAAGSVEELRAMLDAHVSQPRFVAAAWGVKVESLDTGRVLYEHHAQRLLSPASNSKLYTAALALDRLGGEYRIVTPLLASAAVAADGTLNGNLIVSGRGDPSWKSGAKRANFAGIFEPVVAALTKAGVRRITGEVVADATYFRGPPNGAGWAADDLNDYYGAEVSAISLDENYAELRISPATAGEPCRLQMVQPHRGLVIENRTQTLAAGGARRLETQRVFGENTLYVFGSMPAGAAPYVADVTVPRPANWFAAALREALIRGGIAVDGGSRGIRWPETPVASDAAVRLGEIASPPLRELVAAFMKPSQNLETDLIFNHVGESTRGSDTPARRTSEQLGVAVLRDFLRTHGLPADDVRFEEGSGLSRNNLTTANATSALLRFMATHRESAAFVASLPVAGVDGTLRRRMKGTAAEGNVRAKTGTLRWANALSGYVTTAAGERLAFSVMLNRSVTPTGMSARDDVDSIAVMLARLTARSDAAGAQATGRN